MGGKSAPERNAWRGMIDRCVNSKHAAYHNYGGRGITVCERWIKSYSDFLEDMGVRPSNKHSLDRKENDKGYYKENCRWALKEVQDNNKRTNVNIEYQGVIKTIAQWAVIKGIRFDTLWCRLEAGWSVEKSLTEPHRFDKKPKRVRKNSRWLKKLSE